MSLKMRLYKRAERLLKRGEVDALLELISEPGELHELDKRGRRSIGQMILDSQHFEAFMRGWLERDRTTEADFGALFAPMSMARASILKGLEELAVAIVSAGARLDRPAEGGMTLAHDAALAGMGELLDALDRYGADLDRASADDHDGDATPIQMACRRGDQATVERLLSLGSVATQRNHRGATLLHIAVMERHADLAAMLMERGADPGAKRSKGRTPLHDAVSRRDASLLELLLDGGGEEALDEVDEEGLSALHLAAARGDAESVELLIERGADEDLRTIEAIRLRGTELDSGLTARQLAEALGQHKIVALLTD